MKTSIRLPLVCCLSLTAASASAALIAHDGFEGAPVGGFDGYDGGTGFSAPYTARDGAAVVAGNFSYQNGEIAIDGGGAYAEIKKNASSDILFYRQFPVFNEETLYMSFLIRASEGAVDYKDKKEHFFSLGVASQAAEPTGAVEIRFNNAKNWHDLGIRYNGKDYKSASGEMTGEATYFVVLKLHKLSADPSAKFKDLTLFVNPSTLAEPASGYLCCTNDALNNAQYIACRVASSMAQDDNRYDVDEIRLGTTWADVVGPVVRTDITPRPLFTPEAGTFLGAQNVQLFCPGFPNAAFYYTLDGTLPTPQTGTLYTGAIPLVGPTTVRAVAVAGDLPVSLDNAASYALEIHWVGEGADNSWGTAANWTPAISPAGQCVVFGAQDRTKKGVVNNIVPADLQIHSLTYTNSNKYPAETSKGYSYHILQIDPGATLRVTGSDSKGCAFTMTDPNKHDGEYECNVNMTGGGAFAVDSPDAEFLMALNSNNHCGYANLDVSGLSSFSVNASRIWDGRGNRTRGILTCAKAGDGENLFRAGILSVGDSSPNDSGSSNSGTSEIRLGIDNAFHCDRIHIAGAEPGRPNVQSGKVSFQSGLEGASLAIRARDGIGRAHLEVGSHGHNSGSPRPVSGALDLSGGSVDALVSDFYLGNGTGYYWSNQRAAVDGTFTMSAGMFDATTAYVGRVFYKSGSRNTSPNPAKGRATVLGGRFVAGDLWLGLDDDGGMQPVNGTFVLNGGEVSVTNSVVLGTRLGTATNVTARLVVSNGVFTVANSLATGVVSDPATVDYTAVVDLVGGVLAVTNAAGDAALSLADGTLALSGGTVYADSLSIGVNGGVSITLSSADPCGEVILAGGPVALSGAFSAACAEGYEPRGGEIWKIASGGVRSGTFDTLDIPENTRLRYSADGVALICPAPATCLILQ